MNRGEKIVLLVVTTMILFVAGLRTQRMFEDVYNRGYEEGRKAAMIDCVDRGDGIAVDCP